MNRRIVLQIATTAIGLSLLGTTVSLTATRNVMNEQVSLRNQHPEAYRLRELEIDANSMNSYEFFEKLEVEPGLGDSYRNKLAEYHKLDTPENRAILEREETSLPRRTYVSLMLGVGLILTGRGLGKLESSYNQRRAEA